MNNNIVANQKGIVQLLPHPLWKWWQFRRRVQSLIFSENHLEIFTNGKPITIPISLIQNIHLKKGWFFCQLFVTSEGKHYSFSGSTHSQLQQFIHYIQHAALNVLQHSEEWRLLSETVERYQCGEHYFSIHEWESLSGILLVKKYLADLNIDADFIARYQNNSMAQLASRLTTESVSELGRLEHNQKVIPTLLAKWEVFFDQVEKQPLSAPQREACVTNENHTLVVAGAGTGKTSTLIGKAGYLLQSGLAKPENILLLAFGTKAAQEMVERIESRLPDMAGNIKATTFHAFGNRIVAKTEGVARGLTRFIEQPIELRSFIESVIEDRISEDESYKAQLIKYFACYSTPGRSDYDFNSLAEYHEFLQSCRLVTLAGEMVRSVGELRVANILYLHSVKYQYEARYQFNTATLMHRQYKPDFYLSHSQTYIEYWGLNREMKTAPYINNAVYLESLHWKRDLHKRHGTRLAELYSYQLSEGILEPAIMQLLHEAQEPLQLRDLDTLLEELRTSELSPWQSFIDLLLRFLNLFKEGQFSIAALRQTTRPIDKARTEIFLQLFEPILVGYEQKMQQDAEMDFSDMIASATRALEKGSFHHQYDYVLVDEFQDLSGGRGKLLRALLASRPNMRLFAVGDDWQSIYRFNGSDLRFFTRFDQQFSPAKMLPLDKSYRFNNRIHELSARFVTRNPEQLKKTITTAAQVEHPAVQLLDIQEMMSKTEAKDKTARKAEAYAMQINRALKRCHTREQRLDRKQRAVVMLIGRYRQKNMQVLQALDIKTLERTYPTLSIQYQTAHASKGLEADYVIILGLEKGSFPSAKENDELIDLLLPEREAYLFAEERRLLYVAITRARHYVFLVFDGPQASVFAKEMADMGQYFITKNDALSLGKWHCPDCETGWLESKTNRYDKTFYTCSLAPACDHLASACKTCNSPMFIHEGLTRICVNHECRQIEVICPTCTIGTMVQRKNANGSTFYGCNRFRRDAEDCCYGNITTELYHGRQAAARMQVDAS